MSLVRSLGLAIAAFLAVLLIESLLDRFFAFPRFVRLIADAIEFFIVLSLMGRPLAALIRNFDPVQAAVAVEHRSAIFEQRLVTVVSQQQNGAMIHQLRREVESIAKKPEACPRVTLKPLLRPWSASALMFLLMAVLWPWPRLDMPQLVLRFVHPLADLAPATATRLTVLPGNTAVVDGRPLSITATVQSRTVEQPILHLSDDGRTWTTWSVQVAASAATFSYTLPAVDHDWRYFVTAGDATSSIYTVQLLRPPTVTEFRVQCRPPAYLHLPTSSFVNTDGQIDCLVGSQLTIDIACTEPQRRIVLTAPGKRIEAAATNDAAVRRLQLTASDRESFAVGMTAENGMTGTGPRLAIRPVFEHPPVVRIVDPPPFAQVSPGEEISVHYTVADEHGLAQLMMEIHITGSPVESIPLALPSDSRKVDAFQKLTVHGRQPDIGDAVTIRLLAKALSGQTVNTEPRHLLVSPASAARATPALADEFETASTAADKLSSQLGSAESAFDRAELARGNDLLCDARETVPIVEQSLFKLLRDVHTPGEADALCRCVDSAAMCRVTVADLIEPTEEPSTAVALLKRCSNAAKQLRDELAVMKRGSRASVIMAACKGLSAFEARDLPQGYGAAERLLGIREQARAKLAREIRAAGFDPEAPDLEHQLKDQIDGETDLFSIRRSPDDLSQISGGSMEQAVRAARLLAAAKAQTLRDDGDLSLALNLASRSFTLTKSDGSIKLLLAFRASAAAVRGEDAQADALDTERRRAFSRSDREPSVTHWTAVARTLHAFVIRAEKVTAAGADLHGEISTATAAWQSAIHEAAIERLVIVGMLPVEVR